MTTREQCAIRDIPRDCICLWHYVTGPARWVRMRPAPGCPWHRHG